MFLKFIYSKMGFVVRHPPPHSTLFLNQLSINLETVCKGLLVVDESVYLGRQIFFSFYDRVTFIHLSQNLLGILFSSLLSFETLFFLPFFDPKQDGEVTEAFVKWERKVVVIVPDGFPSLVNTSGVLLMTMCVCVFALEEENCTEAVARSADDRHTHTRSLSCR